MLFYVPIVIVIKLDAFYSIFLAYQSAIHISKVFNFVFKISDVGFKASKSDALNVKNGNCYRFLLINDKFD